MPGKTSITSFNYPRDLSHEQEMTDALFRRELEILLQSYVFAPGGGVERLGVGLLYNKRLKGVKGGAVGERVRIVRFNYPRGASERQDTHDAAFMAELRRQLERYRFFAGGNLKSLDVLLVYNRDPSELNIQGLEEGAAGEGAREPEGLEFVASEPKYRLDQVVLNEDLLTEIHYTLSILQNRKIIYEDWGFREVDPEPRAVLNFYGPSGTGKTMTAHAIASYLGCKILLLNYSDIESKYVGDAPKNLVRAFRTGAAEQAVLFFDEADSFLGKRVTNISSSSDQAVNSLRSQMLIQLDNFQGIVIFATNLIRNYDRAFESRIFRHIKFDLPGPENRERIIRKMIPARTPLCREGGLTAEDLQVLVGLSEGFSGRDIKNGVLGAMSMAVAAGARCLSFADLEASFQRVKKTIEDLQRETGGGLNGERKKALEEKISRHLAAGDFARHEARAERQEGGDQRHDGGEDKTAEVAPTQLPPAGETTPSPEASANP